MIIKTLASSSRANCIQIDDGTTRLLLDAGLPFPEIKRRLNFQTSSLSGCLVSHSHADHSRAVKDMLRSGIRCYMAKETARELGVSEHHNTEILTELLTMEIGSWWVIPFPVVHDVHNFGFVARSHATNEAFVYLVDTSYSQFSFKGLTHILIECNFSKRTLAPDLEPSVKRRLYRNHFSLENVVKFLRANDLRLVREIYLLHCSSKNSDVEYFKSEVEKQTGIATYIAKE